MGGGLKVTSKPGRGSTFRMTVIVRNETAAARRTRDAAVVTGLRVLCVEDNPYGRVVLGTVLRELGHSVSFVGRGEAAVETVARNEHDVVLMDVALPGDVDGVEATRRIRALAGAGRTHPDHRRVGPRRSGRRSGGAGRRHGRVSAKARVARRAARGVAGGGALSARALIRRV